MMDIFPQIIETFPERGKASLERKCIFHERLLYQYLQKKIKGWGVKDFLAAERIDNYALYAVTDFTKLFIDDLDNCQESNISGIICDRNAEIFEKGFKGRTVISLKDLVDLYKNEKVKKIIIMSVLHENEIINELLERGISLNDIISFVSILYA